jgi:hypothetical protein
MMRAIFNCMNGDICDNVLCLLYVSMATSVRRRPLPGGGTVVIIIYLTPVVLRDDELIRLLVLNCWPVFKPGRVDP